MMRKEIVAASKRRTRKNLTGMLIDTLRVINDDDPLCYCEQCGNVFHVSRVTLLRKHKDPADPGLPDYLCPVCRMAERAKYKKKEEQSR